ncbi:MAG: hypothetical protein H0V12_05200 [Chloroflexi bacterium]|nr:hypothetical protein [Chloroflexota bacterium]
MGEHDESSPAERQMGLPPATPDQGLPEHEMRKDDSVGGGVLAAGGTATQRGPTAARPDVPGQDEVTDEEPELQDRDDVPPAYPQRAV